MDLPDLTRRDALKLAAVGATAVALPAATPLRGKVASAIDPRHIPRPYTVPFTRPPVLQPIGTWTDPAGVVRDRYRIVQAATTVELLPGVRTYSWCYNGTFPGPTIRATRGRPVAVEVVNALPARHPTLRYEATTSTHLHGAPSRPMYDGYAGDLTRPGQWKRYLWDNTEDARSIWYHDHAVHHTAENVYMGLAGTYQIRQPEPDGLPDGDFDVPVVISDAAFAADGSLLFDDNGRSGVMGDVVLVNGRPWPRLQVQRRRYLFRLLDASIARGYELALSTGDPLVVVSSDGGLLRAPTPVGSLRMSMGERYGVVVDFSRYPAGTRVELRNRGVKNTVQYANTDKVMAFDVVGDVVPDPGLPDTFDGVPGRDLSLFELDPSDARRTRRLSFGRKNGLWVVNDRTWDDVERSGFREVVADPGPGDVEIWEIENGGGGWYHPIHLHMVDFRVLDRDGRPPRPYETGPKDVVFLDEGEKIRVITRFTPNTGRYMIHCHNNSHEDHDMMVQYRVGADTPANDPFSAPAQDLPVR